ncbi:MAG: AraC family transcriptional regulator [Gammaproteobacteria bacterium]|nr:AraC family transcriptional regulator [Gammaproteobacteria bacterium]
MSERPGNDAAPAIKRVLDDYLRAVSFQCQVYYRGQVCETWSLDTAGSGHVNFHAICHGECWFRLPGMDTPLRLQQGDVVVLPHDAPHLLASAPDITTGYGQISLPSPVAFDRQQSGTALICGYLMMDRSAHRLIFSMLPPYLIVRSQHSGAAQFRQLIDLLFIEAQADALAATAVLDRLADALMFYVIRYAVAGNATSAGLLAALRDKQICAALISMCEQPERAWTLEALAEQVFLSRSTFAERFHALLGQTPMDFLLDWRMQRARRWLEQDRLSVSEVAARCGYQSDAAFSKAFKRVLGVGPGELRRARPALKS